MEQQCQSAKIQERDFLVKVSKLEYKSEQDYEALTSENKVCGQPETWHREI